MVESTQAAVSSSNYQELALTLVKMWGLYRTQTIIAFVILLLVTSIFVIRKSSWGKWLLFATIITGASILALDELKHYVLEQKRTAIRDTLLAPVNKVGRLVKGLFGFGK